MPTQTLRWSILLILNWDKINRLSRCHFFIHWKDINWKYALIFIQQFPESLLKWHGIRFNPDFENCSETYLMSYHKQQKLKSRFIWNSNTRSKTNSRYSSDDQQFFLRNSVSFLYDSSEFHRWTLIIRSWQEVWYHLFRGKYFFDVWLPTFRF